MELAELRTREPAVQATSRLSAPTKLLYGIGDIANSVKMVVFGLFTLYFYTSVMGLSGTLVGIASTIGLVWDAVIDPYIGYASDRAKIPFGRRHSFMLVGALTMGVSFGAFLSPPQNLSTVALFVWLLITGLLVRTSTSIYGVPYFALGAELSQDYHERTSVTAVRGALALLGTLAVASLSFVVFFPDTIPGVNPKLNYAGYPAMGLAFGLIMTIVALVSLFGTLPQRANLPKSDEEESAQTPGNFFANSLQALRNRSFFILLISFSLFFLAIVINASLSIHYFTYYVEITSSAALSSFQLSFYVGGIVGVACWFLISRSMEKHRLYITAALATATLLACALFLLGEGNLFGVGNVPVLVAGNALAGFFASILWFMPGSMIADVADEDELATGKRREGSLFGIFFFGQQLAAGLSVLMTGVLIDWYAALIPGQAQQSAQTVHRIAVLYGVLPAALILVAAALILGYSLSRSRVATIQAELQRRRIAQP